MQKKRASTEGKERPESALRAELDTYKKAADLQFELMKDILDTLAPSDPLRGKLESLLTSNPFVAAAEDIRIADTNAFKEDADAWAAEWKLVHRECLKRRN